MGQEWRFVDTDGEAWLNNPTELWVYVDITRPGPSGYDQTRRAMIVTKSWLLKQLEQVAIDARGQPAWAGIPTLLVVPDAKGAELRTVVERVLSQPGLDLYTTPPGLD